MKKNQKIRLDKFAKNTLSKIEMTKLKGGKNGNSQDNIAAPGHLMA